MLTLFHLDTRSQAPVVELHDELFVKHGLQVFIKREDLLHPQVSGNKFRKLKFNLQAAVERGYAGVLSFGGARSNHIHALAFAAQQCGLSSIGIIRGEAKYAANPTLSDARHWGMQLEFVDRETYRRRSDANWLAQLQQRYPGMYMIPEGGSNALALKGMAELWHDLDEAYDFVVTAAGSAGTAAGLLSACPATTRILVVPVLKGDFVRLAISELIGGEDIQMQRSEIIDGYHGGGYARMTPELRAFMQTFEERHGIALDPIYTAKMVRAIYSEIRAGCFARGSRILLIHTGGLQGTREH